MSEKNIHGQHLAAGRRLDGVVRDDLHQQVEPGLRRAGPRRHGGGALLRPDRQPGARLLRHPLARAQQVDQRDTEQHCDARHHDGVGEGLEAHAAEAAHVAQPRHPQHQGREDERQHKHEEQPQEDLTHRLGARSARPRRAPPSRGRGSRRGRRHLRPGRRRSASACGGGPAPSRSMSRAGAADKTVPTPPAAALVLPTANTATYPWSMHPRGLCCAPCGIRQGYCLGRAPCPRGA